MRIIVHSRPTLEAVRHPKAGAVHSLTLMVSDLCCNAIPWRCRSRRACLELMRACCNSCFLRLSNEIASIFSTGDRPHPTNLPFLRWPATAHQRRPSIQRHPSDNYTIPVLCADGERNADFLRLGPTFSAERAFGTCYILDVRTGGLGIGRYHQ